MLYLETSRLLLRDYTPLDKEAYFRLKSDPETMYYLSDIRLFTREEANQDFQAVLTDLQSPRRKFYFFHMEEKDTQEQVGSVGYTVAQFTPAGKLVEAGYFTYPKFWKKGYTTEAFQKVLEFAFTQNDVYRLSTGCLAENVGSERVMQKCGLIKEATHVNSQWHDGKMKTRLEYRMLRSEWNSLSSGKSF